MAADRDSIASLRTVVALCVTGGILFTLAAYFILAGRDRQYLDRPGNHSFSTAATGHSALVEVLRDLAIPVVHQRAPAQDGRAHEGLLLLIEPKRDHNLQRALADELGSVILLVLPKRTVTRTLDSGRWADGTTLLPVDSVQSVLAAVASDVQVIRRDAIASSDWTTNTIGGLPTIEQPQLITGVRLHPLIATEQGALLAEVPARVGTWILADPDIVANHGIDDGRNGELAVHIIERLRPDGRPAVIDETIHGLSLPPVLWAEFFELPWLVVPVAFAVLFVVLGFAAMSRFGTPFEAPPAFRAGKDLLIDNTAAVLLQGASRQLLPGEYARTLMRDVARRLQAPRTLRDDLALVGWLTTLERRGKISAPIREHYQRLQGAAGHGDGMDRAAVSAAQAIHRWRGEILG